MTRTFGPRRADWIEIGEGQPIEAGALESFETLDLYYRSLCALLYNYVPASGHPGGSISSGRFVQTLLFRTMDYDPSDPMRRDADIISYAAGHKAMGLYAMWALRNEILRQGSPDLLPLDEKLQLRLEDLLGFRRNPTQDTALFRSLHAKALDGHPTPATPFVTLATGASGVGFAASLGLALAAADSWRKNPPRVHIIEGEGGLTPGRVAEGLAFAGTASLRNAIVHLDWNQASIDSDRVTREGDQPGDYVQWDPRELFYLHDWNVIDVPDGFSFPQIFEAQKRALEIENGQPVAIVYRTTKGWKYGIEGSASHGAGHKLCSGGFYDAVQPLVERIEVSLPACEPGITRCGAGSDPSIVEECFWQSLTTIRKGLAKETRLLANHTRALRLARARTGSRNGVDSEHDLNAIFELARQQPPTPPELALSPGTSTTLRGQLGKVLGYYNRASAGSIFIAAADLLNSTSISEISKDFAKGFYNAKTNPESRTLSVGGICEDAMSAVLSGVSSWGRHIGVGSSYGAFLAPLSHIAARLHAIGNQARRSIDRDPYRTMIVICGHAGLKTGEDGPTHADPQPLQLLQENFPAGTMVTLTPWDPQEIWPLMTAALASRPAVIAPFVTRPNEPVLDRARLGLAEPAAAATGVYLLRKAKGKADGTIVLQESAVTYEFVQGALPLLEQNGVDLNVYYVASAELFDLLSPDQREAIFPESQAMEAMGITGFTLPTMYRWIRSDLGRSMSLHPFRKGHFLGSGSGFSVLKEAGLDGESQFNVILQFLKEKQKKGRLEEANV
jgi:transketolase